MDTRIHNLLFIDIETVSSKKEFSELPDRLQDEWERKSRYILNDSELSPEEKYRDRAAIYAEFGKVICIGLGYFADVEGNRTFRVTSIAHDDEKTLLTDFLNYLKKFGSGIGMCAHNGREFDYPYLCRRLLINGMPLPAVLNIGGKKSWEVPHLQDTMDYWKFGDYKHYTSLELLASVFEVPSSKTTMKGSEVGPAYYELNDLPKIARYCMEDVVVTARIYMKLHNLGDIEETNIKYIKSSRRDAIKHVET